MSSPHLAEPTPVIAAKNIPYFPGANRLQTLSIYLPATSSNESLIGTPAFSLSQTDVAAHTLVHIHGGAWRDPNLTSASIEATVAHAFYKKDGESPITAVAAMDYTISPTQHPLFHPYDPIKENHSDPAREAVHPMHVRDVLHGFELLRSSGLKDDSYILSGHSAGACLGCQVTLQPPSHYGLDSTLAPPRPAAFLGMNGLYDLQQLVHGLGPLHAQIKDDYRTFLSVAFGEDEAKWTAASPARFDVDDIMEQVNHGKAPKLVVLDQSIEDQLVPTNQRDRMVVQLEQVPGIKVVKGQRLTGKHSDPWREGGMIWDSVLDVLKLLQGSA